MSTNINNTNEQIMKKYYKKSFAIKARDLNKIKQTYLFSEDISSDNKKCFFLCDYVELFNLCKNKTKNIYENIEKNQEVKLHFDIDYKIDSSNVNENIDKLISEFIDETIKLVNLGLKIYDIDEPRIIILSSTTNTKISLHIIYINIVFDDIYKIKSFIHTMESDLIQKKIIDPLIYRTGCFRILWSSKINKENRLEFYKGINYNKINDEQLFYDCLLLNMNNDYCVIDYDVKIQKKETIKTKINRFYTENKINTYLTPVNELISVDLLYKYLTCINNKRANNYKEWLEVGMALYQSNINSFNLWNDWSKQCVLYSFDECSYKWKTFETNRSDILNFNTLKTYAKRDNPIEYSYINQETPTNIFKMNNDTKKLYKSWNHNDFKKQFTHSIK